MNTASGDGEEDKRQGAKSRRIYVCCCMERWANNQPRAGSGWNSVRNCRWLGGLHAGTASRTQNKGSVAVWVTGWRVTDSRQGGTAPWLEGAVKIHPIGLPFGKRHPFVIQFLFLRYGASVGAVGEARGKVGPKVRGTQRGCCRVLGTGLPPAVLPGEMEAGTSTWEPQCYEHKGGSKATGKK